jgi:type 1 glutamine amidotransferase
MLAPDKIAPYDAILFYDMPSEIAPEAQQHFQMLGENGKGLIILHHAFCSYDFWPEYIQIVGGRYQHYPWEKDGIKQPPSTYKHNMTFIVQVDPNHPVTKDITDFLITDETYGLTNILTTVYPLLSTTEPSSASLIGWTNIYQNSRVVTLTLGHDRQAWENPSFVQILSQAIKWTAEKE